MAIVKPDDAADGVLDLDKIAVGPYCVFDDFKPRIPSTDNNQTRLDTPSEKEQDMETPLTSNDFPFNANVRAPWLTTSAEDMILATSSPDDFGRSEWNEWMQWNPASQTQRSGPPLNAQGPVCYLKPGDAKSPLYNRRQNSQLNDSAIGLSPHTIPTSQPLQARVTTTPFTFGENIENTPAFNFNGASLSSPSTSDTTQAHNGFYSPPIWDHQSGENPMFTSARFQQPQADNVQLPPRSTPSLHHSPVSVDNVRSSSSSGQSSPEPLQSTNIKKRKSTADSEDNLDLKKERQPPVKKTAHNMIEKRYRTNLNDKIAALRDSVPSLRVMSRGNGTGNEEDDDPEDLEGLTPAHKLNKATVLSKATEYIRHLEKRNKRLADELSALKVRMDNYEKMAISAPLAMGTPDGSRYQEDPFGNGAMVGAPVSGPPQGMIPVPENMANLHRGLPPQPHYAPQANGYPMYTTAQNRPGMFGPPIVNGRRSNGMMGKLMVGSLAGLMIMEGLSQRERPVEEPQGRGLSALPFSFSTRFLFPTISVAGTSHQISLLTVAKVVLLLGALLYVVGPSPTAKPKSKRKNAPTIILTPAPSLASPVEVRRKAWLTAIQTVWVPQHYFVLEVAALLLKTLKLSTRKVIGWPGYAYLTGTTKEQEEARIKAWEIALDAQLTGGDAEISMSRLILTLMASGTLPDTPARLMLKSLHIRVLLWEVANCGYGTWYMFEELSAKLARTYWNAAREEHQVLANLASKDSHERLPDHLARLLEMDCDEVLIDSIVQRAYNLAWNKPSAENTIVDESMDSVVEDFAISSPLDALAAWWSSAALSRTLASSLSNAGDLESVEKNLEVATRTAPPASGAQLRASVARAVLFDEDRGSHIAAAFGALPLSPLRTSQDESKSSRAVLMNVIGDAPIPPDVRKALTLAKCQALANLPDDEARLRATFVVNNTYLPGASLTLLSFVAAFRVVNQYMEDDSLRSETKQGLERMVSSLRLWIGREAGSRSGLSNKARGKLIDKCLNINKTLVGMHEAEYSDSGYASQIDPESDRESP